MAMAEDDSAFGLMGWDEPASQGYSVSGVKLYFLKGQTIASWGIGLVGLAALDYVLRFPPSSNDKESYQKG